MTPIPDARGQRAIDERDRQSVVRVARILVAPFTQRNPDGLEVGGTSISIATRRGWEAGGCSPGLAYGTWIVSW